MAKRSLEQIKKDEIKILTEYQKYSKENINSIAKNCGFSRKKVLRYLKRLKENGFIWGNTIVVDRQKQGYQKFILLLKRTAEKFKDDKLDDILLNKFENIYQSMGVIIESSYFMNGEYDWVVIFYAPNLLQAKNFSNILFDNHPGIAAKVDLMQIIFTQRDHCILNPDQTLLREFL